MSFYYLGALQERIVGWDNFLLFELFVSFLKEIYNVKYRALYNSGGEKGSSKANGYLDWSSYVKPTSDLLINNRINTITINGSH